MLYLQHPRIAGESRHPYGPRGLRLPISLKFLLTIECLRPAACPQDPLLQRACVPEQLDTAVRRSSEFKANWKVFAAGIRSMHFEVDWVYIMQNTEKVGWAV
jgi:hypothetical protein